MRFDIFEKDAITTYSGEWKDYEMYIDVVSSRGTESRIIDVTGDVKLQKAAFTMKVADGKEMPAESLAISYNKKNKFY